LQAADKRCHVQPNLAATSSIGSASLSSEAPVDHTNQAPPTPQLPSDDIIVVLCFIPRGAQPTAPTHHDKKLTEINKVGDASDNTSNSGQTSPHSRFGFPPILSHVSFSYLHLKTNL